MSITVKIPEKKENYSLFVNSKVVNKYSEKGLGTLLLIKGSGVAFYSYSKHRRAYIFSELSEDNIRIPCFEGKIPLLNKSVQIIYEARGRKIDLLKYLCWNLEKKYTDKIYSFGIRYWIRIASFVDVATLKDSKGKGTTRKAIFFTERYIKERRRLHENI